MTIALPKVEYKDKEYYFDYRLSELRDCETMHRIPIKRGQADILESTIKHNYHNITTNILSLIFEDAEKKTKSGNVTVFVVYENQRENELIDWGEYKNDYHYINMVDSVLLIGNQQANFPIAAFIYINGKYETTVWDKDRLDSTRLKDDAT